MYVKYLQILNNVIVTFLSANITKVIHIYLY